MAKILKNNKKVYNYNYSVIDKIMTVLQLKERK